MATIIGSRAWDQDYEDSFLRSDWDVVMKKEDFINLLNGKNVEYFFYKIRHYNDNF